MVERNGLRGVGGDAPVQQRLVALEADCYGQRGEQPFALPDDKELDRVFASIIVNGGSFHRRRGAPAWSIAQTGSAVVQRLAEPTARQQAVRVREQRTAKFAAKA